MKCWKVMRRGVLSVALAVLSAAAGGSAERKAESDEKQLEALRIRYRQSKGDARHEAGEALVYRLIAAGEKKVEAGSVPEALKLYREALSVDVYRPSSLTRKIRARIKSAGAVQRVRQRIAVLENQLKKDPGNAEAASELVLAYLLELDKPQQAAKYVNATADEYLKTYVPLAGKGVDDLPETVCLELANWYRILAARTGAAGKPTALKRARTYYERFLALHAEEDAAVAKVKKGLKQVRKELNKLGYGDATSREIDLLRLVNPTKHSVAGKWEKKEGMVTVARANFARLTVPVTPKGGYELDVVFVRQSGGEVAVMLPAGPGAAAFCVGLDTYPCLRTVGGSTYGDRRSRLGVLRNGREYKVAARVILQKAKAVITVDLNGRRAMEWKGDASTLRPFQSWEMPNNSTLGLGGYDAQIVFKEATLRMIDGEAETAPGAVK